MRNMTLRHEKREMDTDINSGVVAFCNASQTVDQGRSQFVRGVNFLEGIVQKNIKKLYIFVCLDPLTEIQTLIK